MAKQIIGIGQFANDNSGDTLRVGGDKINDNFNEIYSALGDGSSITVNVAAAATGQLLKFNGSSFVPSNFNELTSNLDVGGYSIVSSTNGDISIAPNGNGDLNLTVGGSTNTFSGTTGYVDLPSIITYKNNYTDAGSTPAPSTYPGYFYTVDGDDNPYVNINITAGGTGYTNAKLLTEYSNIDSLIDVDTTTTAPTINQVLKWNGTNWIPSDDVAGIASINVFETIAGDTGSITADNQTDTLNIVGGTNISTTIVDDTLTIDFSGTVSTSFSGLTDTNISLASQGNSIYWDGTDWVNVISPVIWWELSANGSNDYLFAGPGFNGSVADPNLYVYRGFTYAFDNTVNGSVHPFIIQSTQGIGGTQYTNGQSGSNTGVLYWTVPMDAPNTLYYQCSQHALMNGTITVVS